MTKDPKIPETETSPMGPEVEETVMDDSSLEEFLDYFEKVEAEANAGR